MEIVLLVLDFLCPVFFVLLGRTQHSAVRKRMVRESLSTLCAALLFAPLAFLFTSLVVQGMLCAGIFFVQFLLLTRSLLLTKG